MQDIFDNLKHCLVSREKRVLVALQEIPSILFIADRQRMRQKKHCQLKELKYILFLMF